MTTPKQSSARFRAEDGLALVVAADSDGLTTVKRRAAEKIRPECGGPYPKVPIGWIGKLRMPRYERLPLGALLTTRPRSWKDLRSAVAMLLYWFPFAIGRVISRFRVRDSVPGGESRECLPGLVNWEGHDEQ